jgi:plasmid stabilization system protein ParE
VNLIYQPEADADVARAFDWYERQRTGLGSELLDELTAAEGLVLENPLAFRTVRRDVRRILLRRFPYQLLYRIDDDVIVVVACFHGRRSPVRLLKRT